jgi:glycosyltransferase involved in cell wall biosynthesis
MKICVYSPYVPEHTGGGEKYLFDVARILSQRHQVQVAIPLDRVPPDKTKAQTFFNKVRRQYEQFLNVSLEQVEFVGSPLGTSASLLTKLWWTLNYDVMYYATDGSLFFSLAGRNILHIQVPLQLTKISLIERLKLANWQVKNTNSEFTKAVIERSWQTNISVVHQPMVELELPKNVAKEKIILSVGRFFRQLHSKRQDILVEMFKELRAKYATAAKGWKLVLIGGVEDESFAAEISKLSKGLPIEILHNVSRSDLVTWYAKASIYWHAAGYGIDETEAPEKVEHFGISTVEAMAAGCVPIVLGKGGQKEILGAELREWGWQTPAEGAKKTAQVLKNTTLRRELADQAQLRAALFDERTFERKLWQMVGGEV